ncbi:putative oxidoreductase [Corynebacterium occultum]|uniref:Putative oxidoreductase n=1 Tax=Corynebacterium occultum TaxID=2675219 RepID=A0A6B8W9M1_9CORY|nr:aldo/keto reductase [Corynebacterium occultum]QGU06700.1 putative oxidoreductase [Corynebacterium occultum]
MNQVVVPTFTLNDGTEMPQIGLGTWKITGEDAVRVVREAIDAGYRHFDTAAMYGNESEIGRGIAEAIAAGDVTRDELFITSKVRNEDHGSEAASRAFHASLSRLGLDYLDLYLIHWPWPQRGLYVETFEAIAKIQGLGTVQSIGVANFYEEVLREVVSKTGVVPALNQVELHPGYSQAPLRKVHEELGILSEAWSPLGRGLLLMNPLISDIADQVGRSPAQVILRWATQQGISVVPKTASRSRLQENIQLFDFELSTGQLKQINALDEMRGFGRVFGDPLTYPGEV